MDEQSRRTNILVGNEVLKQIEDSPNIEHTNGVMRLNVNALPNIVTMGNSQLRVYGDRLSVKANYNNTWTEVANRADLAAITVPAHTHVMAEITDYTPPASGGSSGSSAPVALAWSLYLNGNTLWLPSFPPSFWQGDPVILSLTGTFQSPDLNWIASQHTYRFLELSEDMGEDSPNLMLSLLMQWDYAVIAALATGEQTTVAGTNETVDVTCTITPSTLTITANGASSSVAISAKPETSRNIFIMLSYLKHLTRVAMWSGSRDTTPPVLLYDAAAVTGNTLPNIAAQKTGASPAYDIPLSGQTLVYL